MPPDYFSEVQVHVGSRVEIDVATFECDRTAHERDEGHGGVATAPAKPRLRMPPEALWEMPAVFPDSLEVLVFNAEGGATLVAAIELASPANKDRPETRRAFAAKCASLLQQGVGLVVIDIVTNRLANPHNALIELLGLGDAFRLADEKLSVVSYRPHREADADRISVWPFELAVGRPLPAIPLPLDKGQFVSLDLGATYTDACEQSRFP